jgi:hypothetical protein
MAIIALRSDASTAFCPSPYGLMISVPRPPLPPAAIPNDWLRKVEREDRSSITMRKLRRLPAFH